MSISQTVQVGIIFNTSEKSLDVKPYNGSGGTVVTGLVDLDQLVKTVGADRLLDAIGEDKCKLHYGLIKPLMQ